jgi:hypothetical protein
MTAVSLINPYAPQPASLSVDVAQTGLPSYALSPAKGADGAGLTSDQSGQGAGSGTGTGGAQLATLLKRGRMGMQVQRATPESVIEAQAERAGTTQFLEREAQRQNAAKAAEETLRVERAAKAAEDAKAEAAEAAEPEFEMPNPLPTAPILQRDTS